MGVFLRSSSAIASRLVFVSHAVWSLRETIYRVYHANKTEAENSVYWTLTIIIGFMALEGIYTLVIRKGQEYKFFWPTGFFYLTIMIPITCILEIFLLDEELKCVNVQETNAKYNNTQTQALVKFCNLVTLTNKDDQKLRSAVEIGMLGALVIGRWLLPRGEITRDQLSALLLAYISNGADVIEFLNTWNDFPVLRTKEVTITVLVIYSWSLLQFAVVTTKTTDEYEAEADEDEIEEAPTTIFDLNHNEPVAIPELTKPKPTRKKQNYDPTIPRYVQKLMRNKPKQIAGKRSRFNPQLRSRTSSLKSRSYTNDSLKMKPKFGKRKSFRIRAATNASAKSNSSQAKSGKDKKIRFDEEASVSHEPTAQYLQSLAKYERWEEFAESLRQAQERGFSAPLEDSTEEITKEGENNGFFNKLCLRFNQDVFQTVILMLSLELPYLVARICFTIVYDVSSITMVFYTTKNVIMIIFLVYRLWVIFSGKTEADELAAENEYFEEQDVMTLK